MYKKKTIIQWGKKWEAQNTKYCIRLRLSGPTSWQNLQQTPFYRWRTLVPKYFLIVLFTAIAKKMIPVHQSILRTKGAIRLSSHEVLVIYLYVLPEKKCGSLRFSCRLAWSDTQIWHRLLTCLTAFWLNLFDSCCRNIGSLLVFEFERATSYWHQYTYPTPNWSSTWYWYYTARSIFLLRYQIFELAMLIPGSENWACSPIQKTVQANTYHFYILFSKSLAQKFVNSEYPIVILPIHPIPSAGALHGA